MTHPVLSNAYRISMPAARPVRAPLGDDARASAPPRSSALVHLVGIDDAWQGLLARWLNEAGIDTRTYGHLGAFLGARCADVPGCLVIDAQSAVLSGFEPQAILLPLAIRLPIIVTINQSDAALCVATIMRGTMAPMVKPFGERDIVTAVSAAVEVDRKQRLINTHRAVLRVRFASLSPRERQVMQLVTSGLRNKQIGIDLGVSEITVKAHRGQAMRKMAARSLAELVRMADDLIQDLVVLSRNDNSAQGQTAAAADHHSGYSPDLRKHLSFHAAELGPAR